MADVLCIRIPHAMNIIKMFFGDDQYMDWRLRIDILKCDGRRILKDDFGRDLLLEDLAEETVLRERHGHFPPSSKSF